MTTAQDIVDLLQTLLFEAWEYEDGESPLYGCRTSTFEERGLLTSDEGIVLSLADGSEFQITIVRSR